MKSIFYEKGCPDVDLTEDQKKQLTKLWFIYGNDGPKHTRRGNHYFIQRFLDTNQDQRTFYDVSEECLAAVDEVLNNKK